MAFRLVGTDGNIFAVMANTERLLDNIKDKDKKLEAKKEFKENIAKKCFNMNYNDILAKCCQILEKYVPKSDEDEIEEEYFDEEDEEEN